MKLLWQAAAGLLVLFLVLCLVLLAFRLPLGPSLSWLWHGAFGGKFGIARTLAISGPILLTGLGVVVAWRAGLYNIGGEGQMIMGGLLAASTYHFWPWQPSWVLLIFMIISAAAGGSLYAGIAGWLWTNRGVPLVISTILLNFVALNLAGWAVTGPLQEPKHQLPQTATISEAVRFWRPDRQTDLHVGILLAFACAALLYVWLFKTYEGFRTRVIGVNERVARSSGFAVPKSQMRAMLISGGLCGLAASLNYQGITGTIDAGFSQNLGFLGIPVALVGLLNPAGTALSSILFGALFAGSDQLSRFTPAGTAIVYVVQAVAVLLLVVGKSFVDKQAVIREAP